MAMDDEKRHLRDALGVFPTGVTIVTTMTENGPLGMTANSFASVSLDPALVLWSPARRSGRFPAFEAASHFAIHVLAEDQVDLSNAFAVSGHEGFERYATKPGIGEVPLFEHCAARFECAQSAGHDGGDHLILVGEVLRFHATDLAPLVFHRGKYCAVDPT